MLFPLVPYRLKSLTNRLYDLFQQGLLRAELVIVQRNINFSSRSGGKSSIFKGQIFSTRENIPEVISPSISLSLTRAA
jgi:hypothetical protein